MKMKNTYWQFLASVKCALLTLSCITITSIIGTVIPQKEAIEFYSSKYGPKIAQIFSLLNVQDMYNSWWFLALISLLCCNLIICSIDRFPRIWRKMRADGLALSAERVMKMPNKLTYELNISEIEAHSHIAKQIKKKRWKCTTKKLEESTLIFSQKGAWSRSGPYIVHASILVIVIGAIIGSFGGFKGSVMIPETKATDRIFLFGSGKPVALGFDVRCNTFAIEFYPDGSPKEYTSSLTVSEIGIDLVTKEIEVNHPLTHKGITFYQASYESYRDFIITIINSNTGMKKSFIAPFQKQMFWSEEGLEFGILNAQTSGQSVVASKIWLNDTKEKSSVKWIDNASSATIKRGEIEYSITVKQMYATGLQVAKDPGVWWVYIGFGLMLFGLYVAFFMSHRRIWFLIQKREHGCRVIFTGTANKYRPGLEKVLAELGESINSSIENRCGEVNLSIGRL